jgi:hypothetical protein
MTTTTAEPRCLVCDTCREARPWSLSCVDTFTGYRDATDHVRERELSRAATARAVAQAKEQAWFFPRIADTPLGPSGPRCPVCAAPCTDYTTEPNVERVCINGHTANAAKPASVIGDDKPAVPADVPPVVLLVLLFSWLPRSNDDAVRPSRAQTSPLSPTARQDVC